MTLSGCQYGMRTYLAVDGGIDAPLTLGARATDLQGGFGGVHGRALEAGDRLPLGAPRTLCNSPAAWRTGRPMCAPCAASAPASAQRPGGVLAATTGQ